MTAQTDLMNAARRALVCLDLTDLSEGSDADAVSRLCERAQTPQGSVAAVCIWPQFVPLARAALANTGIRVATVVNFPGGDQPFDDVKEDTRDALSEGADEIDLVVPWRDLVAGDAAIVSALVREIKEVCGDAPLKAILETGEIADLALIALAAEAAIDGGADFLKTSTGKTPVSATPEAARVVLETISRRGGTAGFKASGGVKTTADAAVYLDLADRILGPGWAGPRHFRFGASALLDDLLATLGPEVEDD